MKIFDWHKWNAKTYETPKDIIRAFEGLDVCEKRIADIRVIGFASTNAHYAARKAQYEAGVPYGVIDSGGFAYSEQTLIPCTIALSEPIVFTFQGGCQIKSRLPHVRHLLLKKKNDMFHLRLCALLFLFIISFVISASAASSQFAGRVISVADGDTITVLTEDKQQVKIHLYGIDCLNRGSIPS